MTLRPGDLLLAPADFAECARDVLCVIEGRGRARGGLALVLNHPLDEPAQPLAFAILGCGDDRLEAHTFGPVATRCKETALNLQISTTSERIRGADRARVTAERRSRSP